ncbi:MAG TPA: TonB-dependent receptor [Myxococcota bacterium]|nr:TonB-dependent receptor [Myxococcota bacterium]
MRRSLACTAVLVSCALALAPSLGARAQEPSVDPAEAAAPDAPADDLGGIEEIVITTQRREQSLQDVGISVTALSGDEIEKLGVGASVDIAAQTPNLKVGLPAGEGNIPAIFLRGVGLNDFNQNANGSVGWYADDVYISQVTGQTFLLFDMERVEVARGPQGTLYGRNTTGGLVNFISRKPSHEQRDGYALASYGNWDTVKLEGAVGGPLNDVLAARVAFAFNDADGYIENDFPGRGKANDTHNWAGRGALSWRPTETLDVLFSVHGGRNRSQAPQYEHQGTLDPLGSGEQCAILGTPIDGCIDALGYTDLNGNERGSYNKNGDLDIDLWGAFLRIEWEIGELQLISLTAYEHVKKLLEEETDASPNDLLEIDWFNDGWELTQELRLAGESERMNWQTGIYLLWERVTAENALDLFVDLRPLSEANGCSNGFDPDGTVCGIAPTFNSEAKYTQNTKSAGGFGQVEVELIERLNATIGGRVTWEKREFDELARFREDPADCAAFLIPACEIFRLSDQVDFTEWSARFGLDYRVNDDLLLYVSASRGFKSGGFNGGFAFSAEELPPFEPETLWAYEAGVKWDLFDQRLRVNAGGFYYDYEDLQVFTLVNTGFGTAVQILDNASDAQIYGGEIEVMTRPVENLDIVLGLGLLHSELKNFRTDEGTDFSGNELVMAPGVSFNGRVRYELPLGPGAVGLQTDWSFQDEVFFDTANSSLLSEDSYWVWNARASYAFGDGRWEVAGYVRNLLDENYLAYAIDLSAFGLNEQMWGMPRSYGVELKASF